MLQVHAGPVLRLLGFRPPRRALWLGPFISLLSLSFAGTTRGQDGSRNSPEKALREAAQALSGADREKRFSAWEASLRKKLDEMEKEVQAGRGEALLEKYTLALSRTDECESRYLRGRLLGKLGRLEEARTEFACALEREPDYYFAHEGLAIYYLQKERPDEAIVSLERALAINPRFHRGRFTLGSVHVTRQAHDLALEELRKVPPEAADYYGARILIGQCRLSRKEFALAIAEFQVAQALNPDSVEASYLIADAQRQSGDVGAALNSWEAILANHPTEYFAAFLAGRCYYDRGEMDKAEASLKTVLARAPESSRIDRAKVQALIDDIEAAKSGEPRDDRVSLSEVVGRLEKDPDPKTRREAIRVLAAIGRKELITTFANALLDKDYGVRVIAAREMGRLGGPDALPLVKRLLKEDPSRLVRGAAASAIADIGEASAVGALVESLKDSDPYVVDESIRAVSRLTKRSFVTASDTEWSAEERARLVSSIEAWWASEGQRRP